MQKSSFRTYSILGQVGLWLIFFMVYFWDEVTYTPVGLAFVISLSYMIMQAIPVYVHYFVLLPFFRKGRKWLYGFSTVLLLVSASLLIRVFDLTFPFPYEYDSPFWSDMVYNLLLLVLVVAVSSLYYFVEAWIENVQKESLLRSEKLNAELNFLKSQINPHFLFNTLNNIYSYVQTNNEKAAPMLERLSSILRFIVYDGRGEHVTLVKELATTEDLVEIYRMKNPDYHNIHLNMEGVKGFHLVPPLLIINIVENACKHSDATSSAKGFIEIHIQVTEADRLLLKVSNSVRDQAPAEPGYGGVGLENLRRRLEILFPQDYTLEEERGDKQYQLDLDIPLSRKE